MKKAAVIIRDPEQQYEGLRTSLGLLLEDTQVQMFVLHHEIVKMDEANKVILMGGRPVRPVALPCNLRPLCF